MLTDSYVEVMWNTHEAKLCGVEEKPFLENSRSVLQQCYLDFQAGEGAATRQAEGGQQFTGRGRLLVFGKGFDQHCLGAERRNVARPRRVDETVLEKRPNEFLQRPGHFRW